MPSSNENDVTHLRAPQSDPQRYTYRRRRARTIFSPCASEKLESAYETNAYPSIAQREALARVTGFSEDRILVWFQNRRRKLPSRVHNNNSVSFKYHRPRNLAETIGATHLLEDEFRHSPTKDEPVAKNPSPTVESRCKKKLKQTTMATPSEGILYDNATPSLPTVSMPSLPRFDFADGTSSFGTLLSTMPCLYACPRASFMIPMLPPPPNSTMNPVFQVPPTMSSVSRVRTHPVPAQHGHYANQSDHQPLLPKIGRPRKRNVLKTSPTKDFSSKETQTTGDLHRLFALLDEFAARYNLVPRQPASGLDLSTHHRRQPQLIRHPVVKDTCQVSTDSYPRLMDDSLESRDNPVSPISGVYPLFADADSPETEHEVSCDVDTDDEYIDVCN